MYGCSIQYLNTVPYVVSEELQRWYYALWMIPTHLLVDIIITH